MTNQQILEKAISLAIDGGLKLEFIAKDWVRVYPLKLVSGDFVAAKKNWRKADTALDLRYKEMPLDYVIFSHDFAKSLFGEQPTRIPAYSDAMENWQFHLQKMVISDDPLAYLGSTLDD